MSIPHPCRSNNNNTVRQDNGPKVRLRQQGGEEDKNTSESWNKGVQILPSPYPRFKKQGELLYLLKLQFPLLEYGGQGSIFLNIRVLRGFQ